MLRPIARAPRGAPLFQVRRFDRPRRPCRFRLRAASSPRPVKSRLSVRSLPSTMTKALSGFDKPARTSRCIRPRALSSRRSSTRSDRHAPPARAGTRPTPAHRLDPRPRASSPGLRPCTPRALKPRSPRSALTSLRRALRGRAARGQLEIDLRSWWSRRTSRVKVVVAEGARIRSRAAKLMALIAIHGKNRSVSKSLHPA